MFWRLLNRQWKTSNHVLSSLHQKSYHNEHVSSQEEMKKLEDLAKKSLAVWIFGHEEYKNMIQQIFQHVNKATSV